MNISNVAMKPYSNIKNNPKPTTEQATTPAFKGAIGEKVVREITSKKSPGIKYILGLAAGLIGLSNEKVQDIIESLVEKIKNLLANNETLTTENSKLKTEIQQKQIEARNRELEIQSSYNTTIGGMKAEIAEKEAKIAELKKYEAMLHVRPINEIDTLMPNQVIALLDDIKAHEIAAHDSLYKFIMTGEGQEEFIAQMNRFTEYNRAYRDEITEIGSVKKAVAKTSKEIVGQLFYMPYDVAVDMLERVLSVHHADAECIKSSPIYMQVSHNAKTLFASLEKSFFSDEVTKRLQNALKFHRCIDEFDEKALQNNLTFVSETIVDSSLLKSYRTYRNEKDGLLYDFSLNSVGNLCLGMARCKTPEGKIITDYSNIKE